MYKLECDEPAYVRTTFNQDTEKVREEVDQTSAVNDLERFYWITSEDVDEVLAVDNYSEAEKILLKLRDGKYNSFDEAHEENPHVTEVRGNRPPY